MPPVLMGAAVAAIAIAAYVLARRQVTPVMKPVRAEAPVRRLRRDPVTGEYRPF